MFRLVKRFSNFLKTDFMMFLFDFCEFFLLIFILLYAYFDSSWFCLLIFLGFVGFIFNNQDLLVYHPTEPAESKVYVELPSLYNLQYETVYLTTSDSIRLHSYLIKQQNTLSSSVPTLVMFHGNAGNIGQRLILAQYLYHYCSCNIFLVEYRGYGLSEGFASEKGFYKDAEASINHLLTRNDIDKSKIIAFGQSIGGAVAIDLANKFSDKLFAFIVENTFTSLPEIGRELFGNIPGIHFVPDFLFKNQYQSIQKVKYITVPALFISGLSDSMIPPRMSKSLYDKCSSKFKRMLQLKDGNHNNTWLCPGYFQFIVKFIQETTAFKNQTDNNSNPNSKIWLVNVPTQNTNQN